MNRCKCIKVPETPSSQNKFKLNAYYEFDYIPPIKDKASYYRVFSLDDNVSENFSIKAFNEHFKKY